MATFDPTSTEPKRKFILLLGFPHRLSVLDVVFVSHIVVPISCTLVLNSLASHGPHSKPRVLAKSSSPIASVIPQEEEA